MLDPEMRGWAIVVTNGLRLVGLLRHRDAAEQDALGNRQSAAVLEQPLEFLPIWQVVNEVLPTGKVNEKGQPEGVEVTRMRVSGWQLAEALGYPSIMGRGLAVPPGALVLPVNECMSQADMNTLARGIDSFFAAKRKRDNAGLIAGVQ